ncbi:MAG: PIN domain-containing protein [Treponema sp.]|nr:PIN domain-containing protein [Treponema sp.]
MVYADANIFLRFILNDNAEMADYAEKMLENEEVYLLHEVISEMVYVLDKVYKTSRKDINKKLCMLLKYTTTTDQNVMEYALQIYGDSKLDFVDCILCAYYRIKNIKVETFDKKLRKNLINLLPD